MKGEKFSRKQEVSSENKMLYSPAMDNLEKAVCLGLFGQDCNTSQSIANLKYLKECSAREFLDMVQKAVQKGVDFKNLNEYSIADYLDIVQKVDKGERNFQALAEAFSTIAYLEAIDDFDYSEEYHIFKKLGTHLFEYEKDFYQKISYTYNEGLEARFQYQPPSISYLPFFVELYKILGGSFQLKTQGESAQKREFYNLILEKFQKLNALEIGCGPGFGLECFKKMTRNAIGIDKEKFPKQLKGIKIITGDFLEMSNNKALSQKMFNLIYSVDCMEEELWNQADAKRIIATTHEHLMPNGLQLHIVPYRRFSEKVVALKNYMLNLQKQYPNELRLNMQFDLNSDIMMLRTLLFNQNEIINLAEELKAEIIKNEISNHHWVLALKKIP